MKTFKAEFIICGYQGVWFPVVTMKFNNKKELADFVKRHEVYCDILEVYDEKEERVFHGLLEDFLSSEIA